MLVKALKVLFARLSSLFHPLTSVVLAAGNVCSFLALKYPAVSCRLYGMQGGDVFKLVGFRKADVLLTFLWIGKREGGLPLKCYDRGKFARF